MQIVFAYPHLWGTLLAVPLTLLLAALARRERRVVIASMLPWRAVLALPHPRPTRNPIDLEMLCALLIPLAGALALMGVTLLPPHPKNAPLIVVVDNSISMASVGADGKTRLQHAQKWLAKITAAQPDAPLTIYMSGQVAPLLERGDAALGRARLAAISVGKHDAEAAAAGLTNAVRRAKRSGGTAVWISDRATLETSPHLTQIIVGEASRNLALIAAKTIPGNTEAVFVVVQNFSPRAQSTTLSWQVKAANATTARTQTKPIRLRAGAILPLTIPLGRFPAGTPESVAIKLQDWQDDLAADNHAIIPLGHLRQITLDAKKFPRAALALKTVAELSIRTLPTEATPATPLLLTRDAPRELPTRGIILYAPTKAICGLVRVGEAVRVTNARVRTVSHPLPRLCVAGLDQFSLREVGLPAGAEILAAARVVDESGKTQTLPLVAMWTWRGIAVAYLGAAPQRWTGHPAYPVMLAELAERLLPLPVTVPGLAESDNQLRVPATTALPPLIMKRREPSGWSLARWLAMLAMLAGGYVAWCEWSRVRASRQL